MSLEEGNNDILFIFFSFLLLCGKGFVEEGGTTPYFFFSYCSTVFVI